MNIRWHYWVPVKNKNLKADLSQTTTEPNPHPQTEGAKAPGDA